MVLTASTMLPLGTPAPAFELPDVVSDEKVSLNSAAKKKGLLVMFVCKHCPYVVHVKDELARLGKDYANAEIGLVAISSNDAASYPDDKPESLKAFAKAEGFAFPFCYDESQETAKAYTASCTPDFFLFDGALRLVYRGQLDDSRPSNGKPLNGKDLRAAMDALLAGKPIAELQRPSAGCNIKWKPGNAPAYF